jgi:hypothetical protein
MNKGAQKLGYCGHIYTQYRQRREQMWRCANRCGGTAVSNGSGAVMRRQEHAATCTPNRLHVEIEHAKSLLSEKVALDENTPIPMMYTRFTSELPPHLGPVFPTLQSVQAALYRLRSASLPQNPQDMREFKLDGRYTVTKNGRRFLLHTNKQGTIMIFVTDDGIRQLSGLLVELEVLEYISSIDYHLG